MNECLIQTVGLKKVYGQKVAVADLSLELMQGEIFGFLGPNGAGKSTAVKILLGLVAPSEGSARVLGHPPGHPTAMARVGFLPEHFRFHEWLTASEFLDVHGRLYGLDRWTRKRRTDEALTLVGLSEHAGRQLSGFSKGMLQRIGLAQALLHEPALVFLDEPTSALDPFGRILVRTVIRELKSRGTTVFLNSHLLSEVEATCDRVAFIRQGRVLRTIALRDLEAGQLRLALRVDSVTPALLQALDRIDGIVRRLEPSQNSEAAGSLDMTQTTWLELIVRDEAVVPIIAEQTIASGARLYEFTPRRASLEQIFLEVVGTEDSGQ